MTTKIELQREIDNLRLQLKSSQSLVAKLKQSGLIFRYCRKCYAIRGKVFDGYSGEYAEDIRNALCDQLDCKQDIPGETQRQIVYLDIWKYDHIPLNAVLAEFTYSSVDGSYLMRFWEAVEITEAEANAMEMAS